MCFCHHHLEETKDLIDEYHSLMGFGPIARISSANLLISAANLSPSAADTKTIFTRRSSSPSCSISFFVKRTRLSAPRLPVLKAQSPGWQPTTNTPSAPSCSAFRMKLMSSLAVHGILMILLEASYCSFIVPARSLAAYMHCMKNYFSSRFLAARIASL
jgi:hypothetical protein